MVGFKKRVTYVKFSPKMVNPRDIAGNAEEDEEECVFQHLLLNGGGGDDDDDDDEEEEEEEDDDDDDDDHYSDDNEDDVDDRDGDSGLSCQAPGDIGSALGLVGPVSICRDWVS